MERTAAEKYNRRLFEIFERGKENNKKYALLHAVQVLEQLSDKVSHVNAVQHGGVHIQPDDWTEFCYLAKSARGILEEIDIESLLKSIEG